MGKKYLAAQEKNMFLLKEMEKEVVIEVTLSCVAIISDISVISHLSKMIQDLSTLYSEQVAKENRKTPNESILTLFEQLLFEALGLDRGANLHRIHLRSTASCYCLVCCSGTMTPILLDISVEIRIFLKKDIFHRKGFRLISFSRSNSEPDVWLCRHGGFSTWVVLENCYFTRAISQMDFLGVFLGSL